jgi:hypothetical protein
MVRHREFQTEFHMLTPFTRRTVPMQHITPATQPDALSQLDVSQAVLEDEENPSALRARTPQERRALLLAERGGWGAACRKAVHSITSSPVKLLGGAAVVGIALALAFAKRPARF